jgi:hypothetical protein
MINIIENLKDYLLYLGPLLTLFIAITITASILKWGSKINAAVHQIFEDPFRVVFFIIILAILSYFVICEIYPLLK